MWRFLIINIGLGGTIAAVVKWRANFLVIVTFLSIMKQIEAWKIFFPLCVTMFVWL